MKYQPVETSKLTAIDVSEIEGELLQEFAVNIKAKMKDVLFAKETNTHQYKYKNILQVYRQGDAFSMGEIQVDTDDSYINTSYLVRSHLISNSRSSDHLITYYTKKSKKLPSAVTLAAKWLATPTVTDVANHYYAIYADGLEGDLREKNWEKIKKRRSLETILSTGPASKNINELEQMTKAVKSDLALYPVLQQSLIDYFDVALACKKISTQKVSVKAVMLYEVAGLTVCQSVSLYDCAELEDASTYPQCLESLEQRYIDELIPEDIVGKVSVLNMIDEKEYVQGVGAKMTPQLFFIEDRHDIEEEA
jgi:hypothetical protein